MALPVNDPSGLTGLIQLCENNTGLGFGGISNGPLLPFFYRLLNNSYQKIITSIFESQDDWQWDDTGTSDGSTPSQSTYPIATTPLVANQRDYTFPVSLAMMKELRVDVSYDGITYYRATPFDSQETNNGLGNDTTTDARYAQTSPKYDIRANAFFLYPRAIQNVGAMRVEYLREPVEFAQDGATPGIDTAFQPLIALDASLVYCRSNVPSKVDGLLEDYADLEGRMKRYYSRKDEDVVYQFGSQYQNYH